MKQWLLVLFVALAVATPAAQRPVPPRLPPPRTITAAPPPSTTLFITVERLELAADRLQWERWFPPPDIQASPSLDLRILLAALSASGPAAASTAPSSSIDAATLRRVAVRALGRMENSHDLVTIVQVLADPDAAVRAMAARAITQCLWNLTDDPKTVTVARTALEGQLINETDADAKSAMDEALGSLHYSVADDVSHIELLLRTPILTTPMMDGGSGALLGLEALTRRHPGLSLDIRTVTSLRELAVPSHGLQIQPEINALRTLQNIHDNNVATIRGATTMTCVTWPPPADDPDPRCGYQFRIIGVQMLSALDERYADLFDRALHDAAWQVRYEALTRAAETIAKTATCQTLIDALDDRVEYVVRHAVELLSPSCAEREDLTKQLTALAMKLGDSINDAKWQIPETALETLVKFAPDAAHKLAKDVAATHHVWQVRAAAARIAGVLSDEDLALGLARPDPNAPLGALEANVRTAALAALRQMNSKLTADAAIDALTDADDQLVHTAALLLKDSGRHDAVQPLLDALARLSRRTGPTPRTAGRQTMAPSMPQVAALESARDSSCEPRLALLTALQQLAEPGNGLPTALRYLLTDTDPVVASAAADVIGRFAGTRPVPKPTKLAAVQPRESDIVWGRARCARVQLDNGKGIDLDMAMSDAPVAAARFLLLANDKFYDGLTFHRVEVNNFVQAGSPDANELSTGDRFIRDEIGLPISSSAVALVTRGRDTGAGQFFMPLVDLPRFNHEFTVFAYVTTFKKPPPGGTDLLMDAQIVEGTKITSIREAPCKAQ